jgi:DNA repair protein RecN (Recombination protein N)
VQPPQRAPGDDLAASLIRSGQKHQELAVPQRADAVEAPQLRSKRRAEIVQSLCRQLLSVFARQLLNIEQADQKTAECGAMTPSTADLFVEARHQLSGGEAVACTSGREGGVVGVVGNHAVGWVCSRDGWTADLRGASRLSTDLACELRGLAETAFARSVGARWYTCPVLYELRVENLLLIERAELALAPGLNVLTGETGAGKTVLAHALDLLMGGPVHPGRSRAGIVRPGAEEAYVEGVFSVPEALRAEIVESLPENVRQGEETDELELVLARRVSVEGRTRAFVNGRSATVGDLRELGARLISFYGQHEHRKLVLASAQLQMLDQVCGPTHFKRLQACATAYRETNRLESELERLAELASARERELDLLEHELAEIDELDPDEDEHQTLLARRERLRRLEALQEAAGTAAETLAPESSEAPGAAHLLAGAVAKLETVAGIDVQLDALAQRGAAIAIEAQDIAAALSAYCEQIAAEDESLEAVEERLALLERVLRKHGGTIAAVLEHRERARARCELLLGAEVAQQQTVELLAVERSKLSDHVEVLRASRRKAATKLAAAVRKQLGALAMGDATFEIALAPTEPKANGADAAEFTIAPNPGVAAAPLREIASGGELSRVMLALASASNEGSSAASGGSGSTLVFDEVDAGIGGHTARAVGERLQALAKNRQLLCITHLPQIASLAERHFSVVKDTSGEPTITAVSQLDEAEVVSELTRMLGAEEQDDAARRHAEELRKAA